MSWSFYDHFWSFYFQLHWYLLTSLNINWIKSYNINHICFENCVFQFWRKKTENFSRKNGHFSTFCGIGYVNESEPLIKTKQTTNKACLGILKPLTFDAQGLFCCRDNKRYALFSFSVMDHPSITPANYWVVGKEFYRLFCRLFWQYEEMQKEYILQFCC